jgi:hypothetical protein
MLLWTLLRDSQERQTGAVSLSHFVTAKHDFAFSLHQSQHLSSGQVFSPPASIEYRLPSKVKLCPLLKPVAVARESNPRESATLARAHAPVQRVRGEPADRSATQSSLAFDSPLSHQLGTQDPGKMSVRTQASPGRVRWQGSAGPTIGPRD